MRQCRPIWRGRCDVYTTDQSGLYAIRVQQANPDDHLVLPEIISKEPLGPSVRQGDDQWLTIVKWVHYALINAEEAGVTQANVAEMQNSTNPEIKRLLGKDGELGKGIGVSNDFVVQYRQGGRQLWRDVRAQRGLRLAPEDRPRFEQTLEQGRHPIRAAPAVVKARRAPADNAPALLPFMGQRNPGD